MIPLCSLALLLGQIRHLCGSIMNAAGQPKKLLITEVLAIVLEFGLAIPTAQGN